MFSLEQKARILAEIEQGRHEYEVPKYSRLNPNSIAQISHKYNVHERTIRKWLKTDLSNSAVKARLAHRGRKRKLSEVQETTVMDWVRTRIGSNLLVNGDIVSNFVKTNFDIVVKRD